MAIQKRIVGLGICLATLATGSFSSAQTGENAEQPTVTPEPPGPQPKAVDEAPKSESGVSNESEEKASPDVQSQVGLGTEKEEGNSANYSPTSPFDKAARERRRITYGHFGQLGLRAGVSFPFKVMFRFDDSPPCDADQDDVESGKVCGFSSPPALDLALSFALLDAVEPFVWARLGLSDETETNTKALLLFGAGLRIYTMSDSRFKLFFEPAVAIQTEGAIDESKAVGRKYDTDFAVHLHFGGQFDFAKYVGIYGSLGPNVSFVRAIATTLDATVGLQIRVP